MKVAQWVQQRWAMLLWVGIALATLIKLAAALNTHVIHIDTHFHLNLASNYLLRGEMSYYLWRVNDLSLLGGSGSGYAYYLLTAWLQVFGVSIPAIHALMFILGLFSLVLIYRMMRLWWNPEVALVTLAFVASSRMFILQYHGRMDAFGTLAYCAVLYLWVYARNRPFWGWHALVGVLAIVAAEFHILATVYVIALACVYAFRMGVLILENRRWVWHVPTVAYFVGAFLAGCVYLVLHVLPAPADYFIITGAVPRSWLTRVLGTLEFLLHFPLEFMLLSVGIFYLWRIKPLREVWALLVGTAIGLGIVSPSFGIHYTTHLWPMIAIAFAALWDWMRQQGRFRATLYRWTIVFLAVILGLRVVELLLPQRFPLVTYAPHQAAIAYMQAHFPPETVIAQTTDFYTFAWMTDYPALISVGSLESVGLELRGEAYSDYWAREQPQVYYGTLGIIPEPTDFLAYLEQQQFVEVFPNIWVQPAFAQSLGLLPATTEEQGQG